MPKPAPAGRAWDGLPLLMRQTKSNEGEYFLVNGFGKYNTYWATREELKPGMLFKREQDAKRQLTILINEMNEYREEKFFIVCFSENGTTEKKYNIKRDAKEMFYAAFKQGKDYIQGIFEPQEFFDLSFDTDTEFLY